MGFRVVRSVSLFSVSFVSGGSVRGRSVCGFGVLSGGVRGSICGGGFHGGSICGVSVLSGGVRGWAVVMTIAMAISRFICGSAVCGRAFHVCVVIRWLIEFTTV